MKYLLTILMLFSLLLQGTPFSKEETRGDIRFCLKGSNSTLASDEFLNLELIAEAPEEATVTISLPALEKFSIDSETNERPILTVDKKLRHCKKIVLIPLQNDGSLTLPAFTLSVEHKGKKQELKSPVLSLSIQMQTSEGKRDIQEAECFVPQERLTPPCPLWLHALLWAGILLVLFLAWRLWLRYQKNRPAPPPIPAHVTALKLLDALEKESLPQHGRTMEFYDRIQQILRNYIEDRFGIHAPEQTTEEFLQALTLTDLQNHQALLQNFLKHCDLVRFARQSPSDADTQALATTCRSFIQNTIPQPTGEDAHAAL